MYYVDCSSLLENARRLCPELSLSLKDLALVTEISSHALHPTYKSMYSRISNYQIISLVATTDQLLQETQSIARNKSCLLYRTSFQK